MTSNKMSCRRRNSFYAGALVLLGLLAFLVAQVHSNSWAGGATLFCVFYAGVITVFFIAQILAFVVGHTNYSDAVEQPKFEIILNEEKEWRSYRGSHG